MQARRLRFQGGLSGQGQSRRLTETHRTSPDYSASPVNRCSVRSRDRFASGWSLAGGAGSRSRNSPHDPPPQNAAVGRIFRRRAGPSFWTQRSEHSLATDSGKSPGTADDREVAGQSGVGSAGRLGANPSLWIRMLRTASPPAVRIV